MDGARDEVTRVETSVMPRGVIFEKIARLVLSRVITLGGLDLDSKAGLPTNIHLFLLRFSFKGF